MDLQTIGSYIALGLLGFFTFTIILGIILVIIDDHVIKSTPSNGMELQPSNPVGHLPTLVGTKLDKLFHSTTSANVLSIQANGLMPVGRVVWLSRTDQYRKEYTFRVNVAGLLLREIDDDRYLYEGHIPSDRLTPAWSAEAEVRHRHFERRRAVKVWEDEMFEHGGWSDD